MTGAAAPRWRRRAVGWATWAIALGALAQVALLIVASGGRPPFERIVAPGWLAAAVVLAFVPWLTNIVRNVMWSRFVGAPLSVAASARVFLGSIVGAAVTPTATGAPLIKAGLLAHEGVKPATAVSLVTLQAVEDVAVIAVAVPLALWVSRDEAARALAAIDLPELAAGEIALAALGVAGLLVLAVARSARLRRLCKRALGALAAVGADCRRVALEIGARGRWRLAAGLAMAALQWGARWGCAVAVLLALGAAIDPVLAWALQWFVFALASWVPTPGGIGGIEAAFALLYAPFVALGTLAAALALWRLILFYGPVGLAAVLLLALQKRDGPSAHQAADQAAARRISATP